MQIHFSFPFFLKVLILRSHTIILFHALGHTETLTNENVTNRSVLVTGLTLLF